MPDTPSMPLNRIRDAWGVVREVEDKRYITCNRLSTAIRTARKEARRTGARVYIVPIPPDAPHA